MKAFYESRTYLHDVSVSASVIRNLDFVAHWHKDIEMVYVCEGCIGTGINSDYRILHAGDISICGSNDIHYYESEGMASKVIMIIFKPELFGTFKRWPSNLQPDSVFIDGSLRSEEQIAPEFEAQAAAVFESIFQEMENRKALYPFFADMKILELFLSIFRHLPAYYRNCSDRTGNLQDAAGEPSDIKPMQKALKYLEENYTMDISLEQISSEANLSRFYFSRLFRKTTGMNFNVYLNRLRTDKAEELIRTSKKPIIEIVYETGFTSVRTFNRSFKAIKGYTPLSLRQEPKSPAEQA